MDAPATAGLSDVDIPTDDVPRLQIDATPTLVPAWERVLSENVLALPRTRSCMRNLEEDHLLNLKLPKPNALPGQVPNAFAQCFTLHRHTPSIYKIGLTHCPLWRFHNPLYGYVREKRKWEGMTIVFVSHESTGPALQKQLQFKNILDNRDATTFVMEEKQSILEMMAHI